MALGAFSLRGGWGPVFIGVVALWLAFYILDFPIWVQMLAMVGIGYALGKANSDYILNREYLKTMQKYLEESKMPVPEVKTAGEEE